MTRHALFFAPALLLAACAQEPTGTVGELDHGADTPALDEGTAAEATAQTAGIVTVGTAPAAGDAIPAADAAARADQLAGQTVRVEGTVSAVCQMKGCWLTLQTGGAPIRVVVPKDTSGAYAFAFPKDAPGTTAVLEGTLAVEQTPVETLRHLAEDAGQSPEEVAAITAPQREVVLTATGARITRGSAA